MRRCGGCESLGSHARECPNVHGAYSARMSSAARAIKSLGDTVGPNNMALSNLLWRAAADLEAEANRTDQAKP